MHNDKKGDVPSVKRQTAESQNGGNKKTRQAKFSEKRAFFTPQYAHVRACISENEMFGFKEL